MSRFDFPVPVANEAGSGNRGGNENGNGPKIEVNAREYRARAKAAPAPMRADAYYGLAGEVVKIAAPNTEACQEAILIHLLVAFGNIIGREPWMNQADFHHTNEYTVVVGDTSAGRKGTAWKVIKDLLELIDPEWSQSSIRYGIQTGEALVSVIRDDKIVVDRKGKKDELTGEMPTMIDPGVSDKRLLLVEEEFSRFLSVGNRQGNQLSEMIRIAFDGPKCLFATSKANAEMVTNPHISMIGHVTPGELIKVMHAVEVTNGFANRFLFIESGKVNRIPRARIPNWTDYPELVQNLKQAFVWANVVGGMNWSNDAVEAWDHWYLTRHVPGGAIGSILARAEAHVLRLAMIYAILDCRTNIGTCHLNAALAVWDYAAQSARRIFGSSTGDRIADKIVAFVHKNGPKMRTEITKSLK